MPSFEHYNKSKTYMSLNKQQISGGGAYLHCYREDYRIGTYIKLQTTPQICCCIFIRKCASCSTDPNAYYRMLFSSRVRVRLDTSGVESTRTLLHHWIRVRVILTLTLKLILTNFSSYFMEQRTCTSTQDPDST